MLGVTNFGMEHKSAKSIKSVYTLSVAAPSAGLDAVADALRASPGVLLAEPVAVRAD